MLLPLAIAQTQAVRAPVDYVEVKRGAGQAASVGDIATVHLHVKVSGGKVIVDTVKRRQPYSFAVKPDPDQAWKSVVKGMRTGGVRRCRLSPDQGWGDTGNPPVVPKNATLIVTVTLKGLRRSE